MKKTKILLVFVLFCIALSFFSGAYADDEEEVHHYNVEFTAGYFYTHPANSGGPKYSENDSRMKIRTRTIW